ncbi:MAG: phosphodiesterase [Ruminococcaceae bacterium]|nr:phosphodiesterase [Oscillospiraceae bacterium]
MKLLIASDIHGDLESMELVLRAFESEDADKILLLGDLLYHGPRNDLPKTYAPKAVIELLNKNKDRILAVRGNCDTEVDQMVLNFPILADYAYLSLDGLSIFATHGHHHNTQTPPPLSRGEILLHGHTHVLKCEEFGSENFYLNPGSAALPKENNPRTYMVYENRTFTVKDFDGNTVLEKKF